jgi:DNA-binding response OmpR family regulator
MERPRFPEGLRVLLLESAASSSSTSALLQGLKYEVMVVGELSGALAALKRNSSSSGSCFSRAFDVVLADSQLLAGEGQLQLLHAAQPLPVVLMGGESCSAAEMLAAVEAGAADVLDRPLSQLKLRNLWQHTVRMMMSADSSNSGGSCHGSPRAAAAAAATPTHEETEQQQLQDEAAAAAAQQLLQSPLLADSLLAPAGQDCSLDALELAPLLPSQLAFDPDTILLDLDAPVQPDEPSLDDLLLPCGPPAESDTLLGCSSDHAGCSSGATVFHGSKCAELESSADTASCLPGITSPVGTCSTPAGTHGVELSLLLAPTVSEHLCRACFVVGLHICSCKGDALLVAVVVAAPCMDEWYFTVSSCRTAG